MNPQPPHRRAIGDRLKVVKCNHCGQPVLWEHRALHQADCRRRRNAQKLEAMNLSKNGERLYCIMASHRRTRGQWGPPKAHYLHAKNAKQAKSKFLTGEPKPQNIHVIEVGLAIGWFQNEQGLITA